MGSPNPPLFHLSAALHTHTHANDDLKWKWSSQSSLHYLVNYTELLVFPATPTLQHNFTIQLGSSTITPSASVRNLGVNLWWPADLQRAHCKDCSILQVCTTQHQKDQALSDRACCTTSCPGPCHFQAGLLQCSSGWTSIKHNQTSTNDSECSGTTGLQRAQVTPLFVSLHWLPVAAHIQFKTLMFLSTKLSLLPLLACTYLNNARELVLQALPLSVCLFKINLFMYSPIVSHFG